MSLPRINVIGSKITDLKFYTCKFCGIILKRKCQQSRHEKIHTGEECRTCNNRINDTFFTEYKITQNENNPWSFKISKNHKLVHSAKLFTSKICGEKFHHSSSRNRHRKSHTKRIWSCEICERKFSRKDSRKRHMRIHTGKNYTCRICEISFMKLYHLKEHHLRMHKSKMQYRCALCDKKFKFKSQLIIHIAKHNKNRIALL